jgi:hypothetical protein
LRLADDIFFSIRAEEGATGIGYGKLIRRVGGDHIARRVGCGILRA